MSRARDAQNGLRTIQGVSFVRVELPSGGAITTLERGTQAMVLRRMFADWPQAVFVALSPNGLRWAYYQQVADGEIVQAYTWSAPGRAASAVAVERMAGAALAR